jgi:tripartite-type tricarboxylate transporter receptor subunit TctC
MKRAVTTLVAAMTAAAAASIPAAAQPVEQFYKGKAIKILFGTGPGGSYGLYSLLAARHIGRHIPGNPNIITESMPGAGGLTALNYSYNVAAKDGSVLHLIHSEVLFETLLTKGVRFNAQKYNWIGRFSDADYVTFASRKSGVKTLDDAKKRPVVIGATGPRAVGAIGSLLLNRTAGTKFKVIAGYKGTADIYVAMDRGEVDGISVSWANAKGIHSAAMAMGDLVPFFVVSEKRVPELPNVPAITEFGNEDERAFQAIYVSLGTIGRSLAFPPGVPQDRVNALREAYEKTIKDPAFLEDVKSKNILFTPMSGADLKAYVDKLMATPAARVEAARKIYADLIGAR